MDIRLAPGKYVVAVSGGVDSVVLLDVLSKKTDCDLVVAHFDHGIREESKKDADFVNKLAKSYGLKYYSAKGNLGSDASEELARQKRYEFLHRVLNETKSTAIVTAHHNDDLIETAIINVIRGTGRKGISSIGSNGKLIRPLLKTNKEQIIEYAEENNLNWVEDESNQDTKYLRNKIRRDLMQKINQQNRGQIVEIIADFKSLNKNIDRLLSDIYTYFIQDNKLDRNKFNALEHSLSKELIAHWFRQNKVSFDSKKIEEAVIFAKNMPAGKSMDLTKSAKLQSEKSGTRLIIS